ncbi:MAG: hypothetical protein CPSOU_1994 [uncultured Paraburkholderia sp.]|nr:MAG: hypothetical protein CPSOU_1994 [uncultured Paraburkholderia sp.]
MGIVVNVVLWDGNAEEWQPPEGATAVKVTDETGPAYIGFPYTGGKFEEPPPPQVAV